MSCSRGSTSAPLDASVRIAALLLAMGAAACAPDSGPPQPSPTGRAQATYEAPSTFRLDEQRLQQVVAGLAPDSPQREVLADAVVTRAELLESWGRYAGCLRAAGYVVSNPRWDPAGNTTLIYTYSPAGAASARADPSARPTGATKAKEDADPAVDACEERHWYPVEAVYAAGTPPRMDPDLSARMVVCMRRRGYDVRGAVAFGDVVGAVAGRAEGARVEAGRRCLAEVMATLHPDLPYYPQP